MLQFVIELLHFLHWLLRCVKPHQGAPPSNFLTNYVNEGAEKCSSFTHATTHFSNKL